VDLEAGSLTFFREEWTHVRVISDWIVGSSKSSSLILHLSVDVRDSTERMNLKRGRNLVQKHKKLQVRDQETQISKIQGWICRWTSWDESSLLNALMRKKVGSGILGYLFSHSILLFWEEAQPSNHECIVVKRKEDTLKNRSDAIVSLQETFSHFMTHLILMLSRFTRKTCLLFRRWTGCTTFTCNFQDVVLPDLEDEAMFPRQKLHLARNLKVFSALSLSLSLSLSLWWSGFQMISIFFKTIWIEIFIFKKC
jgi:hypothetical protein